MERVYYKVTKKTIKEVNEMTTVELAEYVLNHDMDEVIAKCEEIIENDFNDDDFNDDDCEEDYEEED